MTWNRLLILSLLLSSCSGCLLAQPDSTANSRTSKKKLTWLGIGAGVTYTSALVGLNELWYAGDDRTSFHFFNDNAEWKQVDKLGHFYAAFHITHGTSRVLENFGVREKRSSLIGAFTAFGVLLPIEIFDGHSKQYGASVGDLVANTAGASFFLLQDHLWNQVRIHPKFSFHRTRYADKRPGVLGDGFSEEILKDYNGQTHWLSVDVDKFTRFPNWLNIAIGYGAEKMIYARDHENVDAGFSRPYRQLYFSVDWDLTAIKTNSKAVRTLLFFANMIKLPAPTIGFDKRGMKVYAFYF